MSLLLLASFRSLSLNVSRRSVVRSLATVSENQEASTSAATPPEDEPASTDATHQWQTRPARKLTAKEHAIPGRVNLGARKPDGHSRPHLGVETGQDHGLYGFFRRVKDDLTGVSTYETLEPRHKVNDYSGRAWLASELRRKSFKDLHTLWYVLARERNLLATQSHEARRIGIQRKRFTSVFKRDMRCRKSMARIKQVLNERRLAYDHAVQLYKDGVTAEQLEAAEAEAEAKAKAAKDAQTGAKNSILEADMEETGNRSHA